MITFRKYRLTSINGKTERIKNLEIKIQKKLFKGLQKNSDMVNSKGVKKMKTRYKVIDEGLLLNANQTYWIRKKVYKYTKCKFIM